MSRRSKEGVLFKKSDGVRKKLDPYNFKYGQAYFQYFKGTETAKAEGQILTSQITRVESCVSKHIGEFPFEVYFNTAKGSPWLLYATSEEERICWMEAIKPGSAAHLRPLPQPQQPPVDLHMSWPQASGGSGSGGFPVKRELPYVLHPGQQQRPQQPPTVLPQPPQPVYQPQPPQPVYQPQPPQPVYQPQPPQPVYQPQPPQPQSQAHQPQPQAYQPQHEPPHRTQSQQLPCFQPEPEPYMQPGNAVTSLPASFVSPSAVAPPPAATPPIAPSRPHAHTLSGNEAEVDVDTDTTGYMRIEPVSIPNPPLTKKHSRISLISEESKPSTSPASVPMTPVGTVVDMMKSMSSEQMQMLLQMLSKLDVGREKTTENSSAAPQLLKMISQTPDLGNALLVTEDDEQYEPRPEWAKANANTTEDDLGQASDLQKEALFISSSSLTDHVPIGKGQFGEVFKATLHKGTPGEVLVAVKTSKKNSTEKDKTDFLKEMTIMSTMLHPNIVRLYGLVNENQESPSIVLEYLPNGDLKHFLAANRRPTKQLVKYMIDVAMGMHYIAERGLVHRDLAARNVLVGENEVCKVADFGLLRELAVENSIYQSKANAPLPVRWMAPESIQHKKFSVASDVWSYGILMWEMFNPDKMPYPNMDNMELIMKVAGGFRLPPPRGIPPIVVRLMRACWHKQPEKRPSFLIISTLLTTKAFAEIETSSS